MILFSALRHHDGCDKRTTGSNKTASHDNSLHACETSSQQVSDGKKRITRMAIEETKTKKSLSELKSVVDQFNFIYKIVHDINKVCFKKNYRR